MPAVKTHVIKVTGVPDELLRLLDDRVSARHYGGRAEYLRELIRRDLLESAPFPCPPVIKARTPEEVDAAFARIDALMTRHIEPLAEGADSREAIYGDRG